MSVGKVLPRMPVMAPRLLGCALEEIPGWHANLFVKPHLVAFVAVAGQ